MNKLSELKHNSKQEYYVPPIQCFCSVSLLVSRDSCCLLFYPCKEITENDYRISYILYSLVHTFS